MHFTFSFLELERNIEFEYIESDLKERGKKKAWSSSPFVATKASRAEMTMDLRIELDSPESPPELLGWAGYFEPGGTVSGRVIIWNKTFRNQEFKKDLEITFTGKAWTVITSSVEIFFTQKLELGPRASRTTKGRSGLIQPGRSDYSFCIRLPPSLPSTFNGRFGKVDYYADVTLCSRGALDKRVTLPFNVLSVKDLNVDARASRSAKILMEKSLGCLCCRNGPIRVTFGVPFKGCVPGGFLQFTVEIINHTSMDLKRATVSLIQEATVCSGRNTEIDSKVVCRMKGPSVKAGETKMWFVDNFPVPVPGVPPSDSDSYGCVQYITIQYELRIKVGVRDLVFGCLQESALSGSIPIIVGTIPLIESELEGSSSTTILSTSNTDANLDEISEVYMPSSSSRSTSIELPTYVDSQRRYNSSTRYKDSPPPSYIEAVVRNQQNQGQQQVLMQSRGSPSILL